MVHDPRSEVGGSTEPFPCGEAEAFDAAVLRLHVRRQALAESGLVVDSPEVRGILRRQVAEVANAAEAFQANL